MKPSEKETTREEEKFSAIHLLQTLDLVRHGNLNEELQNESYVGREKYPTTFGVSYELMVRRSGRYQSIENSGNVGGRVN